MKKEEYFEKILEKVINPIATQIANSPEFAKKYHNRDDKKEIETEIKKIAGELSKILIRKLAAEGYLDKKELDIQKFKTILDQVTKEYTAELDNESNA